MIRTIKDIENYLDTRNKYGIQPGLERVEALLERLDNPEKKLEIIHVAGTNGKGSTVHFIEDVLIRSNYKVGVFTSPSFTGLKGYFLINQKEIFDEKLIELFNIILPIVEELDKKSIHPTSFEIITALTFLYFVDKTDIVIVEAGMGGRGDTTNVVNSLLSVITSISIDHTNFLGNTIEQIAFEKAGIIKNEQTVIIGDLDKSALAVVEKEAELKKSKIIKYSEDFNSNENLYIDEDVHFDFNNAFIGQYQKHNISVAIKVLLELKKFGYKIKNKNIQDAIKQFKLLGRFEKVCEDPTIVLDSAHNLAGIQALKESISSYFENKRVNILFAAFKDKDVASMIDQLLTTNHTLYVTTFNHDRALELQEYKAFNIKDSHMVVDWKQYLKELMKKEEEIFLITGSMHFIMKVHNYLETNLL